MTSAFDSLVDRWKAGEGAGIPSICSSHPKVIEATLRHCLARGTPALIEATCNQVNQDGGYTGLTPKAFAAEVGRVAGGLGFDKRNLILGGDHLGPNPWRKLAAEAALQKAEVMISAFASAGYAKLHLDASMGCAGEPEALDDQTTAHRAVRLARAAEAAARSSGLPPPHYIVGTEVPAPGGAQHSLDRIEPTRPEQALRTLAVFRQAFEAAGLADALTRVVALVAQPGVEFGHETVVDYNPERARPLSHALDGTGLIFEAHSTDYQPQALLADLVRDRFCILKVGPALTFALRQALYGLDLIASELDPAYPNRGLAAAMEEAMLAEPAWWETYYRGSPQQQRVLRHYSFSDRIRYYWPHPKAQAAVARLQAALSGVTIPDTLLRQFFPRRDDADGLVGQTGGALVLTSIDQVLRQYSAACQPRN